MNVLQRLVVIFVGASIASACAEAPNVNVSTDTESALVPETAPVVTSTNIAPQSDEVLDTVHVRKTEPSPILVSLSRGLIETKRKKLDVVIDELWHINGSMDDTSLVQPGEMIVGNDGVVVIDNSYPRAVSLSTTDGHIQWVIGTTGSGPGEWRGPLSLAGAFGSDIVILDRTLRRISMVSQNGKFLRSVQVDGLRTANAVCITGGSRMVVNAIGIDSSLLITFDAENGKIAQTAGLPWPEYATLPGIAAQLVASPVKDGCLIGTTYGSGIAKIHSDAVHIDTIAAMERVATPTIEWRKTQFGRGMTLGKGTMNGTSALARVGRYVVVAFGGRTQSKRRILDFYEWSNGQYVGSLATRTEVLALAGDEDTLYLRTEEETGFFRIGALKFR